MLNISFSTENEKLAQTMQQDLANAGLRLDNDMLIVLLNEAAVKDSAIQAAIKKAQEQGTVLAPVLLQKITLPETLTGQEILDLTKGYKKDKLLAFVKLLDISQDTRQKNRRLFFYVAGAALLVFLIAIASLVSGVVAPPNDEFATENALQDAQIETVTAPDLEAVRPRTTEDALNFPATLESARSNLRPFMIGTATAIPLERQASAEAIQTQAVQTSTAIIEQTQAASTPEASN